MKLFIISHIPFAYLLFTDPPKDLYENGHIYLLIYIAACCYYWAIVGAWTLWSQVLRGKL